jgi:hypothetical protein
MVRDSGDPALIKAVETGNISVSAAAKAILAAHSPAAVLRAAKVIKKSAIEENRTRREVARQNIVPLPDGMDYRVGACWEVMNDIAVDSGALGVVEPPWKLEAEPLFHWSATYMARVIMPGGSILVFPGNLHGSLLRRAKIFEAQGLQFQSVLTMLFTDELPVPGAFVRACSRPVLWFTKGRRRTRQIVSTVAKSPLLDCVEVDGIPFLIKSRKPDKKLLKWQQGEIWQWVEPLTDPGDFVVDPFAGTGKWGEDIAAMGSRWIGCDIARGGSEEIELPPDFAAGESFKVEAPTAHDTSAERHGPMPDPKSPLAAYSAEHLGGPDGRRAARRLHRRPRPHRGSVTA